MSAEKKNENMPLIRVVDLVKTFGEHDKKKETVHALNGVSMDINKGDVVVIIGPSGSGKSTFLRSLNLLETSTSTSTARRWVWCSSTSTSSRT